MDVRGLLPKQPQAHSNPKRKEIKMQDENRMPQQELPSEDGIDRRGMLQCMAWVGTGLVWGMTGGMATSRLFGQAPTAKPTFTFAQISDSHLGFARDPNKDVAATLKKTIARINA